MMAKAPSVEISYQVKGELLIDVITELIETGSVADFREFVAQKELFVRMDAATVKALKAKLSKQQGRGKKNTETARHVAMTSSEPCRKG